MTDLNNLTKKIQEFREKRGWTCEDGAKNQAISLVLEAAEFLELFQWTKSNKMPRGKRRELEEELVDVLYWVLVIAHDFKIDLGKAFTRKMKKNKLKYPC